MGQEIQGQGQGRRECQREGGVIKHMASKGPSSGGIGFLGMLAILFIGLKLGRVIDWDWPWVLAPLWMPMAVLLVFVGALLLVAGIACVFSAARRWLAG